MRKRLLLIAALGLLIAAVAFIGATQTATGKSLAEWVFTKLRGGYFVQERIALHGSGVEARLRPVFAASGLGYPPRQLAYVAFKDSRVLEVYARNAADGPWIGVKHYPVLGMSGKLGPKLREGDRQVPEGVYALESLNPNSRFHLSLRLNYPNDFDRKMAVADGRTALGSDIMIHGSDASIGCLAMGDSAAEDLFVLAALAGPENVRVVINPTDLRINAAPALASPTPWTAQLYDELRRELGQFQAPGARTRS